ncbi:hypothetical protein XELAEV_18040367mg [Xenopus laevis]|uniref:Uncharacterized protein n=1 Tax=Xenopus laevis TaxID=8355 RepID=A0A974C9K1_XENLA|nr:hypothetical protein XELAEV_18040367mg [Xenopus laevis]
MAQRQAALHVKPGTDIREKQKAKQAGHGCCKQMSSYTRGSAPGRGKIGCRGRGAAANSCVCTSTYTLTLHRCSPGVLQLPNTFFQFNCFQIVPQK